MLRKITISTVITDTMAVTITIMMISARIALITVALIIFRSESPA